MSLDELGLGVRATVASLVSSGDLTVGLMELGFVPGTAVHVVRAAPLGDPLEIDVAGARLAIRRAVAAQVQVTVDEAA